MNDHKAISNIFAMCREDERCKQKFGESLQNEFEAFVDRLEKKPLSISVTHPWTFEPLAIVVTPDVLLTALWNLTYDERDVVDLPIIISSILAGSKDRLTNLIRIHMVNELTVKSLN